MTSFTTAAVYSTLFLNHSRIQSTVHYIERTRTRRLSSSFSAEASVRGPRSVHLALDASSRQGPQCAAAAVTSVPSPPHSPLQQHAFHPSPSTSAHRLQQQPQTQQQQLQPQPQTSAAAATPARGPPHLLQAAFNSLLRRSKSFSASLTNEGSVSRTPPTASPSARSTSASASASAAHNLKRRSIISARRYTGSLSARGRSGSGSGSIRKSALSHAHSSANHNTSVDFASDSESSSDADSVVRPGQMEDCEVHELFCEMSALELDEDAGALSTSSSDYSWVECARCAPFVLSSSRLLWFIWNCIVFLMLTLFLRPQQFCTPGLAPAHI